MRGMLVAIALLATTGARADGFAPIVIDEVTFNQIVSQIDQLPMPGNSNRQIMSLLGELQKRAQMQAARAAAPKLSAPEGQQ